MTVEKKKGPVYRGVTKYWDKKAGYAVWLPSDWRKIDMIEGRRGCSRIAQEEGFELRLLLWKAATHKFS